MEFQKAQVISLKSHPQYNEKWLHERITSDTALLGLGDLVVKDVERPQPRAGRLDLLLSDPETHTRYEVEIQLGATDETHIIRTIEYWDIERNRYPKFEHVAVIVAEDITSRFLNVISLFNKSIPLIAIQMQALQVGDMLTLNATRVLDLTSLGSEDDDEPGQATDRAYWAVRGAPQTIAVMDHILELVNEVSPGQALKYNKHYVGLSRSGIVDNFVEFVPKKEHVEVKLRIPRSEELTARMEQSGLDLLTYDNQFRKYRLRVDASGLARNGEILRELIATAGGISTAPTEEPLQRAN